MISSPGILPTKSITSKRKPPILYQSKNSSSRKPTDAFVGFPNLNLVVFTKQMQIVLPTRFIKRPRRTRKGRFQSVRRTAI